MSEWTFMCGCRPPPRMMYTELHFNADSEEEANAIARAHGWHVDWAGPYPGVACSEECWKRSNDEWESRRPVREAARAERLALEARKKEIEVELHAAEERRIAAHGECMRALGIEWDSERMLAVGDTEPIEVGKEEWFYLNATVPSALREIVVRSREEGGIPDRALWVRHAKCRLGQWEIEMHANMKIIGRVYGVSVKNVGTEPAAFMACIRYDVCDSNEIQQAGP